MKKLIIVASLIVATPSWADIKILVEFDGDNHKIVKTQKITASKFLAKSDNKVNKTLENKSILQWSDGDKVSKLTFNDPRIIRAPMSRDGYGHDAIIRRNKGSYIVTLKGKNINLKNLTLQLPGKKNTIKIKNSLLNLD